MNELEAVALARYVRALCPQQKFDEYTPDAWHDVLGDYDLQDCKQAAADIARRQPWIAPAEIIDEVKRNRNGRLERFQYEPGHPDETSLQSTLRRRAQIADVINGLRPPEIPWIGVPRPTLELAAGVGREIPEEWEKPVTTRVRSALDVRCPNPACQADVHKPCTTPSGRRMTGYHGTRMDALKTGRGVA
ncbi:hypothetical protein ACFC26_15970 [Kitasatospora purpeofusca]|uniref:zinc finger domain-containing protein n=1 Tax=Kitasatospora purpeofusca TaxID=67352 RepID=UPI0035DF1419